MTIENLVIVAVLLVLLAEVTYLVAKLPRQTNSKKRLILVDTSVLIDGRIVAVARSGFIGDTLAIPRSVVGELQFLADNADHDKRARARFGLDVVKELQDIEHLDVTILQDGTSAKEGVDNRLLELAKKHTGAVICTIDYNLNKVAVVEGIHVLNVNELAQSLRMSYLPGERLLLELVQKGQDSHQAVGYLKDGTMVVVEHAYKQIGQTVEVEFIRSLQTAAGKMMFAKRIDTPSTAPVKQPKKELVKMAKSQTVKSQPKQEKKSATQTPTVYHSDTSEQRRHVKQIKGRAVTTNSRVNTRKPNTNPRTKTSAQREAALIDLVEKQQ